MEVIMEHQQNTRIHSIEKAIFLTRIQAEMRNMANPGEQHSDELTRLRIERNRAAKHARCAILHNNFRKDPQWTSQSY
jgi:hypothetical protein